MAPDAISLREPTCRKAGIAIWRSAEACPAALICSEIACKSRGAGRELLSDEDAKARVLQGFAVERLP